MFKGTVHVQTSKQTKTYLVSMEGKRAYYHGYKSKKVIILNVYFCDMYNGMYMFVYCLYNFLNCKTNFFGVHSKNIQKLKKFIMTIFYI